MPERDEFTHADETQAHATVPEPPPTGSAAAQAVVGRCAPAPWLRYLAQPRHAIPILTIVGVALYLVNLGGYPFYTKGEPREAVTVFAIVHGGGIILPQRAGVEIPSKPLLMHWLAALCSLLAGRVNEFTVRLPSAAFAIAGILVCYLYVRRLFDEVTALIAALTLATTFQYLQAATGARVDMTLTFFMEVAFFEFILMAEGLTRRRTLLYVALALAVLTKGPIGLALPGAVALIWMAIEKKWYLLGRVGLVRGAIVVALLAGGWYVAALIEGGGGFFRKQILAENLLRLAGGPEFREGHVHRFYYMELALLAGFMPWTLLLPIVIAQAARFPRALDPRIKYLMVWFVTVLVFYNLPQSKRGVYLLSLYPAFATIVAIYASEAIARPAAARGWVAMLSGTAGYAFAAIGAFGLAVLALLVLRPEVLADMYRAVGIRAPAFMRMFTFMVGERWFAAVLMPTALVAVGLLLLRQRPTVERLVVGIAAGMACISIAVNVIVVPAIANTLSLRDFTDHAMKAVDGRPVGYLNALNYDFAFYSRRTIRIVSSKDADPPEYLVGWRGIYEKLSAVQRNRFEVIMVSNPTSLDGGDQMVLLRRRGAAGPPRPGENPEDGFIEAGIAHGKTARGKRPDRYDSDSLRNSLTDFTRRGSTSAAPPRRLISQIRVISES